MIENMQGTPIANRLSIALFGRRNAGKSSLINALTGQNVAVTSAIAGTTTDPVYKAMELLPVGPVIFIDTAGLDDQGDLGRLRMEKTYEVFRKCHLALLVIDASEGIDAFEVEFAGQLKKHRIPAILVVNKADRCQPDDGTLASWREMLQLPVVMVSASDGTGISELKESIIAATRDQVVEPPLLEDLVQARDLVVLVTPIDSAAPKGRMILPQQQAIRAILDLGARCLVTRESELKQALALLKAPPQLVITDSQAFQSVSADTPPEIPLTSFSILFARQKGNLAAFVQGARRLESLKAGDRVLIVEGCTHHRQSDDIGTVKIPRWIRQIAGEGVELTWSSGAAFPADLRAYALVVHCGSCMLNRREMLYRQQAALEQNVAMTNYGVMIARVLGILPRAIRPFQDVGLAMTGSAVPATMPESAAFR